jgi:ligand-binding sensor domain-containing protein
MKAIIRTFFKPVAILKYLFFPFMVAQSQDVTIDKITEGTPVIAQAQTPNDLWLATENGLYKYNKGNQKILHITGSNSVLAGNHVKGICTTSNGNVFAVAGNEIFRYDGYAFLTINSENSNLPEVQLTAIATDNNDNVWIGTEGKGLLLMWNYKVRTFNTSNSVLTSNTVLSVEEKGGNIYVTLANNDVIEISGAGMKLIRAASTQQQELAKKD